MDDFKPNWWAIGGLVLLLVITASAFKWGGIFAKWFAVLLIVGTIGARWDNTWKPWIFGKV